MPPPEPPPVPSRDAGAELGAAFAQELRERGACYRTDTTASGAACRPPEAAAVRRDGGGEGGFRGNRRGSESGVHGAAGSLAQADAQPRMDDRCGQGGAVRIEAPESDSPAGVSAHSS